MPAKKRIVREDIIDGAFEVLRSQGEAGLNTRNIASHLGCSTQPIYCEFENMEDLRVALSKKVDDFWWDLKNKFLQSNDYPTPFSWYMSFLYIARNEKHLFRYRYLTSAVHDHSPFLEGDFPELFSYIADDCRISKDDAKLFHRNIIVFLLGLAVLVNTGDSDISEAECLRQLQRAYEADKAFFKIRSMSISELSKSIRLSEADLEPIA